MKYFIRILLIGVLIGTILTIIQVVINYSMKIPLEFNKAFLVDYGIFILYSVPLTFTNAYFFDFLNHKALRDKKPGFRFLIGMAGSAVLTLFAVFIIRIAHKVMIDGLTYNEFLSTEQKSIYVICLMISLLVGLMFHAVYYYKELQKTKVTEQKVIAGTASAKFDALKNQLDPHFLFNSLNVLSSLIDENPQNAQKFTTSLSKIYRYVLEQKDKPLVTVDEELSFARTYMTLLKMRFEESIIFDLPEKAINPESKVVPLSLQLLLENAVKHNVVTSSKPLRIKIYEKDNMLVVENNLQPKQILKKSSGVGLSNIKQRYHLLSNKKVNINQSANNFEVAIPLLTKQIAKMKRVPDRNLDNDYLRARKHVEEIKEFYFNLLAYCIVIPFLIFIWWFRTPNVFQWFWFPIFGWGMGLAFHGYIVFVNDGLLGSGWEKRKIEQFMREEEERSKTIF